MYKKINHTYYCYNVIINYTILSIIRNVSPYTHTHTQWHTLNDTALTHRHTFIDTPTPTFIFTFIPLSYTTTPAVSMVITMFLILILFIISLFYFNVVLYLSLYCRLMKLVGAKISKIKSCLQKRHFGILSNLVLSKG